jgi:replicative DNA helicase
LGIASRQARTKAQEEGMTTPQSDGAEKAFLSCVLQRSSILNEACDTASSKLFHHPSHRKIFDGVLDLWKEGKDCDLITITEHMQNAGTLELSGGAGFIAECFVSPAVVSNWREYLEILRNKHTARLAISAAEKIIASAQNPAEAGELSEIVQKALVAIAADAESSSRIESVKEIANARLHEYDEMRKNKGRLLGITSGFDKLDKITGGFRSGQLVVIGAPTKGGKTTIALNMAMRTAGIDKNPVGIISLEMSKGELIDRIISSVSAVDLSVLSSDQEITSDWMNKLSLGVSKVASLPIWVRDESSINCLQLRAAIRRMVAVHNVKMIVVDYIQLLEPTNKTDSRERQVAEASRTLKMLAKECNVVVLALTQLNADGASRESRAIEHDCDLFLTVSQDEKQEDDWFLNIKLARACPRASIPLTFKSHLLRFDERF